MFIINKKSLYIKEIKQTQSKTCHLWFLYFVIFVSWSCIGTVCQCLLCGGWNYRSLLSLLVAQGWQLVNQHTASYACRWSTWPHSENRTLTGSDKTKSRCCNSFYAPAWPSCVCCVWWVSNKTIKKHVTWHLYLLTHI